MRGMRLRQLAGRGARQGGPKHGRLPSLGLPARTALLLLVALTASALPAAAPAALVQTCAPSFNGPGTPAPGTVVAPALRVVKSSYAIGTCDSTIAVTARSANG